MIVSWAGLHSVLVEVRTRPRSVQENPLSLGSVWDALELKIGTLELLMWWVVRKCLRKRGWRRDLEIDHEEPESYLTVKNH